MKACSSCVLLLALVNMANCLETKVTPVEKVVLLMKGMLDKGVKDKKAEEVQFAEYKQFCEDTHKEKVQAIQDGEDAIEATKATIEKTTAMAEKLGREIKLLDGDIAVWKGDEVAATKVRAIDKAAYDALHKDYSESISALARAHAVLKARDADIPQAEFMQLSSVRNMDLVPPEAKRALDEFLALGADGEGINYTAPEAYGYEFQSQSIVDVLAKLQDKFIEERTSIEKAEMKSKEAYEMLMQELKNEIAHAEKVRSDKAEYKAKQLQKKADAEGDLTDLVTTKEADVKYDTELVATCQVKAQEFESRQQLRVEEMEAIKKAIAIIESEAVAGAAEEHLPTLLQTSKGALAQLRSSSLMDNELNHLNFRQEQAAEFLRERSKQYNSRVLSTLAARMGADPFGKVKKMIKDLILKLMEEATAEVEHKGWCDTELSTNKQTREEKTAAVETLTADVDMLETSIAKLSEDITTLTEEIAQLDAAMAEATKLRAEEKAKNADTIADAKDAQIAVAQAMTVLKEFYSKASEATALLQSGVSQEPPPIWESPYKGLQGENGGVISMLEVIESDFARLQADTESAEIASEKAYEEFMEDSKIDKADKTTAVENKTAKKQDQEQALIEKKKDLEGTQKELTAALEYYDKLKPSCVDPGVSFKDRTARRREEIESLQEALKILNGEDLTSSGPPARQLRKELPQTLS